MSARLVLLVALLGCAGSRLVSAEDLSIKRLEQQLEEMDYPGAIVTGTALLERGGNMPVELARIYELVSQAQVATEDEQAARSSFRKLLALRPDYQVSDEVSPKIRRLLAAVLAEWAGRPGLTVVHGPPSSARHDQDLALVVKVVEDPEQMVHSLRLTYFLPGSEHPRRLEVRARAGENALRVPLRALRAATGPLRYGLEVLDPRANVLVLRGDPVRLVVDLRRPELVPRLRDPRADLAAQLARRAEETRQRRRGRTFWGYGALGAGAACLVTAAVLYGVGVTQGNEAHEQYQAARTDEDLLRHGDEVAAARDKLLAGHVLAAVGAVAMGAAVYLLLTRPAAPERPRPPRPPLALGGQAWPTLRPGF